MLRRSILGLGQAIIRTENEHQLRKTYPVSVNKVNLIGIAASEAVTKTYDWGAICSFKLRTQTQFQSKDDNKEPTVRSYYHRIIVRGVQANSLPTIIKKGAQVLVEGTLTYRKWTPNGTEAPQWITEIVVPAKGIIRVLSTPTSDSEPELDASTEGSNPFGDPVVEIEK